MIGIISEDDKLSIRKYGLLKYSSTLSQERDLKTSQKQFLKTFKCVIVHRNGARGSVLVKALCCKPEGRGFKSR
jgi:hypothetical protein